MEGKQTILMICKENLKINDELNYRQTKYVHKQESVILKYHKPLKTKYIQILFQFL